MEKIITDQRVRHGKPIIEGTRITVEEILGALAGGMTFEDVEREYGVAESGIRAAIRYAAGWFQSEEITSLRERAYEVSA